MCRDYQLNTLDGGYVSAGDTTGVGSCPYDPRHNSTATYADGQLYTATVSDFSAQFPMIRRASLRTGTEKFVLNGIKNS